MSRKCKSSDTSDNQPGGTIGSGKSICDRRRLEPLSHSSMPFPPRTLELATLSSTTTSYDCAMHPKPQETGARVGISFGRKAPGPAFADAAYKAFNCLGRLGGGGIRSASRGVVSVILDGIHNPLNP